MASLTPVFFCTGNERKVKELLSYAEKIRPEALQKIIIVPKDLFLPEYQGEAEDICREKCKLAQKVLSSPVIVEDTSLGFNTFNGLPGPYIKCFIEKLKVRGLHGMLQGQSDKTAVAQTIFAYFDNEMTEPTLFVGRTEGEIVAPQEYELESNEWDPVFKPKGSDVTFSQMTVEQKNSCSHRGKAAGSLLTFLANKRFKEGKNDA